MDQFSNRDGEIMRRGGYIQRSILALILCAVLAACGSSNSGVTTNYTVGGTVSGITGSGLVLEDNGGNNLAVSANGPFTFTAALASGTAFSVTVLTQPTNPSQSCVVTSGSGTLSSSNVTNVSVTCTNTYTIGGTVINLVGIGGGLQLQDNGGDNLLVNANGTFTFPTALVSGSSYSVTVSVQPSSPAQTCEVTDGGGTATANVSSVAVDCGHKEWTWMGGSNLGNQQGTYGTQGTPAPGNIPGARTEAIHWTDAAGNIWLFGGIGYDSAGTGGNLNDLWKYSAGQWTWVGGSNLANQQGTYGTQGTASPSNIPGARYDAITWTDANGNIWLFGGFGFDSTGTTGDLNDLWKYSAGQWTWMGGSNLVNQKGTYGTQGTAAPGNIPGAREGGMHWTDATGNFWLFGGTGPDSAGIAGILNDLWEYSGGQWTWMGGSNLVNQKGTYGTQGTPSPSNIPGGRWSAVTWTDANGNVWLFGGGGFDSTGTDGNLNDLWKYRAGQWTWMGGSNLANQKGTYGTQGTPAPGNIPGGRIGAAGAFTSTDAAGDFWLFGGQGIDSTGAQALLNDLWKYSAGQWTWMGGSNLVNQKGTYGTQGTPSPSNIPGARIYPTSWTDANGNIWLFGGQGHDSKGTGAFLNDLWKYEP